MDKYFEYENGEKPLQVTIQKMNAFQAEAWLIKAGLLLGKGLAEETGLNKEKFSDIGSIVRSLCSVDYEKSKPLMDELLACCYIVEGNYKKQVTANAADMIQSPITIMRMRIDSAKENFGFLLSGKGLSSLMEGSFMPSAQRSVV